MRHLAASRVTKLLKAQGVAVKRSKNWVEVTSTPDQTFHFNLLLVNPHDPAAIQKRYEEIMAALAGDASPDIKPDMVCASVSGEDFYTVNLDKYFGDKHVQT